MKKLIVILAAAAMVCSMASCGGGRALKNEVDTLSYALGTDFGTSLKQLLEQVDTDVDMKVFYAAVEDVLDVEIVDRYVAALEEMIRRRPELWLWSHDRWKQVPNEDSVIYNPHTHQPIEK